MSVENHKNKTELDTVNKINFTVARNYFFNPSEQKMVSKWLEEYKATPIQIIEACERTKAKIGRLTMNYADKVLISILDTERAEKHVTSPFEITKPVDKAMSYMAFHEGIDRATIVQKALEQYIPQKYKDMAEGGVK